MENCHQLVKLREAIGRAEAVVVGAGAGLSTAAGYTYGGERFRQHFADFIGKYHFSDMYSAGFFPFPTEEEKWAFWSRHIYVNRYDRSISTVHKLLLSLVMEKDYFVLTTNVDHLFQNNGFDKERLFYTQGDYGLWQCKKPCHKKTYDNEAAVRRMVVAQKDMRIPSELVPRCPVCGGPMEMNLRIDDTFVEDEGWHRANERYRQFLQNHREAAVLYLELGVGMNTPGIIKFPFWRMTRDNSLAIYACLNMEEAYIPAEIESQSIIVAGDIHDTLSALTEGERV